jgi:hypothetical protein
VFVTLLHTVGLKVRRQVVAQVARWATSILRCVVLELHHFVNQCVNLRLLANDDLVELLEQVVAVAGFDFEVNQALVYQSIQIMVMGIWGEVLGCVGLSHGCIGHDFGA